MVKDLLPTSGGGGGMLHYRLYYFDGFSGHIDHFREFEAESDDAAVTLADGWSDGRRMELWIRERRLKEWEGARPSD
jgi:hypothetical protein